MDTFLTVPIKTDMYNGLTIDLTKMTADDIESSKLTAESFDKLLEEKLKFWIENGIRCIWFKIPALLSNLIPILVKHGFEFHHAKPNFVMLTKWLSNEENRIPKFANTVVGVGGIVYDPIQKKVLLIQEKNSRVRMWKFPGGYSEPNEDIGDTACREVKEETGIDCKLESVISFRHNHRGIFNCADFYFVCLLTPKFDQSKIEMCQIEIDDCQWFTLSDARKELQGFNHYVFEEFLKQYLLEEFGDNDNRLGTTIKSEVIHSQYGPYKRDERVYSVNKIK